MVCGLSLECHRAGRFVKIVGHNVANSTQAYEKLVGESAGAAAAEATAANIKSLYDGSRLVPLDST